MCSNLLGFNVQYVVAPTGFLSLCEVIPEVEAQIGNNGQESKDA